MPALPEKMAGEWLPRPAAYRPAGTKKVIKIFLKKSEKALHFLNYLAYYI